MADAAKPKMDLAAIAGGAELKHVQGTKVKGADEALAHASMINLINKQGEIAVPAERLAEVEKGQSAALARAGMLSTIAKQGVKEVNPDAVAAVEKAREAKVAELNAGNKVFINVVAKPVDEQDIAAAKAAAAGVIGLIGAEKPALKHVEAQQSNEALNRAAMLNTISKQGVKAAKPAEEKAGLSPAVARGAMLNSINKQGIIASPADSVAELEAAHQKKVEALNAGKKEFYVITSDSKDDGAPAAKPALDLAAIAAGAQKELKHVEVKESHEALDRAGLLKQVAASGEKSVDPAKVEAAVGKADAARVAQSQMLHAIKKQGVISTPEASAAEVEAARAAKVKALEAEAAAAAAAE